jgi:hypothetical protein
LALRKHIEYSFLFYYHYKSKIPLVPRRPSSQDKDKKLVKNSKGKNPDEVSPPPPEDPDEKLIFDAFKNANSFVNHIVIIHNYLYKTYE